MRSHVVARCTAILALLASASRADDRPTLAGTWSASPLVERWVIGAWGDPCGPKPAPSGAPGGAVSIREEGSELVTSGAGRPFRTSECWESLPGGVRSAHGASKRAWHTECSSAPGDARQARIVTNLSATDTTITLDETGQYQFVIDGQNCTASARRSRSYILLHREGEAIPEPAATETAAPAPVPAPQATAGRCASPGEPAKLSLWPPRKLLRPGERFTFGATVADAAGCALDARPTWSLATPGARAVVQGGGTVVVGSDATDGAFEVAATLGARTERVRVEIASPSRYLALLEAESRASDGGAAGAAVSPEGASDGVPAQMGAAAAVARDDARGRRTAFVVTVGGSTLALLAASLWLARRARRKATDLAVVTPPPPAPRGKICPTCGERFAPEASFCGRDGTTLVLVN